MNRPTQNLCADHELVAAGLQVLRNIADEVQAGADLPVADTALVVRFLRDFVVGVHLCKEAEAMWPAVAMRGAENCARLVGELLRLQDEVTTLTHSLVLFWEPIGTLSDEERAGFVETVEAVTQRLERMRAIEEEELFPACNAAVPADDQLDWVRRFAEIEHERGSRRQWADRLRPLIRRRGV